MFSMLLLVLGDNFLLLFVGWEAVGLCSYLLIGFWYRSRRPPRAAKKAFIVNRVGDFGFGLGILAIWSTAGHAATSTEVVRGSSAGAAGAARSR